LAVDEVLKYGELRAKTIEAVFEVKKIHWKGVYHKYKVYLTKENLLKS
jgi:hypothetical protein